MPVPASGRQSEEPYKSHIVEYHAALLLLVRAQSTTYHLEVFRQREGRSCQLDKLHVGAVEAFGENIDVDKRLNFSFSEIIQETRSFLGRSLGTDGYRLNALALVVFRYAAGMFDAHGIYDALFLLGKLGVAVV